MQFELILYTKMMKYNIAYAAVGVAMLLIFFMACNLHKSFVTLNLVFLDSMERSLSLESGHVPVNDILCPHIFLKFDCRTKCENCLVMIICVV